MFRSSLLLAAFAVLAAVLNFGPVSTPEPAFACTGGPGPFEEFAANAGAIVIAEAVTVGGPENTAPTATPTPMTSSTPEPFPSPAGTPQTINLAGIGATLRVIQTVAGDPPASIDVDAGSRQQIEENIRRQEANPNLILPCPLDFLVQRYVQGQTYFLVLNFEDWQGWYTFVQWEIDGSDVSTGGVNYEEDRLALVVSRPVLAAYFPGLAATAAGAAEGAEANWVIEQRRVPVEMLVAAVQGVRSGAVSTAESEQPATPRSGGGIFTPPDTGDAGLR